MLDTFREVKKVLLEIDSQIPALLGPSTSKWHTPLSIPPVGVALIGEVKAGKSMVGNVLMREELLPSDVLACTSRMTVVMAPPRPHEAPPPPPATTTQTHNISNASAAAADASSGAHGDAGGEEEARPRSVLLVMKDGTRQGPIEFEGEVPRHCVAVRVSPDPVGHTEVFLERCNFLGDVILQDFPGVNDNTEIESAVFENLSAVSGVIFVLNASQGCFTQSARQVLQALRSKWAGPPRPILFVVNKMDTIAASLPAVKRRNKAVRCMESIVDPENQTPEEIVELEAKVGFLLQNTMKSLILQAKMELVGYLDSWLNACYNLKGLEVSTAAARNLVTSISTPAFLVSIQRLTTQRVHRAFLQVIDALPKIKAISLQHDLPSFPPNNVMLHDAIVEHVSDFTFSLLREKLHEGVEREYISLAEDFTNLLVESNPVLQTSSLQDRSIALFSSILIPFLLKCNPARSYFSSLSFWYRTLMSLKFALISPGLLAKEIQERTIIRVLYQFQKSVPSLEKSLSEELSTTVTEVITSDLKNQLDKLEIQRYEALAQGGTTSTDMLKTVSWWAIEARLSGNKMVAPLDMTGAILMHKDWQGCIYQGCKRSGKDCCAKLLHLNLPREVLQSIFLQLFACKFNLKPGFDCAYVSNTDGTSSIAIITDDCMSCTSSHLEERMIDMHEEALITLPPVEMLFATASQVSIDAAVAAVQATPQLPKTFSLDIVKQVTFSKEKATNDNLCAPHARLINTGMALSLDEAASIVLYTMDKPVCMYLWLNKQLRSLTRTEKTLGPWLPYLSILSTALHKLKPFAGAEVYRGMSRLPEKYTEKFNPGRVITWYGLASTSVNRFDAERFATSNNTRGMIVTISHPIGYEITDFSAFPSEQEVLMLPGSKFKVTSFEDDPSKPHATATIDQIPY
ncbi:hypothetical protein Pelo_3428 [Pelomyxa schiedti]|nr:hypothetical protein Pelo_3428 [Pelomyxa schiedti]